MNGGFNKQIYKHTGTYVRVEKGSAARKEQMPCAGACINVEYILHLLCCSIHEYGFL